MKQFLLSLLTIFLYSSSLSAACVFPDAQDGLTCQTADLICSELLDGYTSTLPDPIPGNTYPGFPTLCSSGGTIENAIWFSFIPCSQTVQLNITPSNCTTGAGGFMGMQAAIFSECDYNNTVICASAGTDTPFTLNSSFFVPGDVYILLLDGYGGSVCDFTIDVLEGIHTDTYDLSTAGPNVISGTTGEICHQVGDIYSYEVPDCEISSSDCNILDLYANEFICYEWTVTPSTVTIYGGNESPYLDLTFDAPGDYTISVERFLHPFISECSTGSCDDPMDVQLTVNFLDTIKNSVNICPGELVDICGQMISVPGVYECIDEINCQLFIDTIIMDQETNNLGVIYLCPDECFTLESVEYCNREDFVVQSAMDCSLNHQFSIKDMSVTIDPAVIPILDCNNEEIIVVHSIITNYSNALSFKYLDEDGMTISLTNIAMISEPGEYQFIAYSANFEASCADTVAFTVLGDFEEPDFSLSGEDITCNDQEALLEVMSMEIITDYQWEINPNLTGDNGSSITALATGEYNVTVTGENGCTAEKSIMVDEILLPAEIEVEWDNLDCNDAQTLLSFISDVTSDSVLWAGPFDFLDKTLEPTITVPGDYTLHLYSNNGCDYTEIFEVLANFQDPVITNSPIEEWACKTESLDIFIDYSNLENYNLEWSTINGIILGDIDGKSLNVGSIGSYVVEVTDENTGCSKLDTFEVVANDLIPTAIDAEGNSPLCHGIDDGTIEIISISGGVGPFDYFVNGEQIMDLTIENLPAKEYNISVVDFNGCEMKTVINLEQPLELIGEIDGPEKANFDDFVEFQSIIDLGLFEIDIINWYDKDGMFIGSGPDVGFNMIRDEIITMEIIDINGCVILRTASIVLDEDYDYYVPNLFTPNDDGVNDRFAIFTQDLPASIKEFYVYDRWGSKVFEAKDITASTSDDWGWDGRHNGSTVAPGVFVYYAIVETLGIEKTLKGSVTVMK